MTTFATDPGTSMRAKAQRARGPHAAKVSASPPGLAEAPVPPIASTGQSCPVGDVGGSVKDLGEWLERWQGYLFHIEGKAERTAIAYNAAVRRMARDLDLDCVDQLTREAIERHLKRRSFSGIGPSWLANSIIAIRRFCQYLQVNGRIPENPALGIATPKTYRKAMKVLTLSEVRRLLFNDGDGKLPRSRKELLSVVMFCVQYGGALRPAELGRLLTEEVQWLDEARMFAVLLRHAKHSRFDSLQPIGVEPSRYLGAYLQLRPELAKGPFLFPCRKGRPMSGATVRRRFTELCAKRKIEPKGRDLVPKILRTARCTHLLDEGIRIDEVQLLMRHASIETTRAHYAYNSENAVVRMLVRRDPLRKKKRTELPMQSAMNALFGGLGGS